MQDIRSCIFLPPGRRLPNQALQLTVKGRAPIYRGNVWRRRSAAPGHHGGSPCRQLSADPLGRGKMPIAFHAAIVRATEEDWGTLVDFSADETLEAERYLMVQRSRSHSEQDIRLGMNDVYIETCGQGWSWYGHIESVQLFANRISVQLDTEAAARMRDNGAIDATFDLPSDRLAELRFALRRAFAGRAYYSESAA